MDDILGRIIMPFAIVLALIIVPVLDIALKADESSQKIIDNAVQEFVDNSRSSGKVTASEYEKMMNTINRAQPLCDIHITYGKETFIPDGTNEFYGYHDDYNEIHILDTIYTDYGENMDFLMSKGDYLKVTVRNSNPTFGSKILSMFIPNAANAITIATSYGGFVEENGYTNR